MSGYTPDEKLRLQQLRELRRRWLKDQELSPREPVLPPQRVWPMERFWNKFLQDQAPWKKVRETEHERGRVRERETQNLKQAPGSELSAQSPTWGSNSRTARS
uniref:NADH dehydrogenase [ubiquinone] 1 beta subcomplex subunit 6 n=1 Tax=Felis catus TaxID=9685 RepID=A0ABI7X9C8_FELCA